MERPQVDLTRVGIGARVLVSPGCMALTYRGRWATVTEEARESDLCVLVRLDPIGRERGRQVWISVLSLLVPRDPSLAGTGSVLEGEN